MKRLWTPARRVWLWGLAVSALAISTAPTLAATCPEVKFGGPVSLNIPDFTSVNGSWVATAATINGQSSSPKQNQGGIYQWTQVAGPAGTLAAANTPQVLFTAPDVGASGATVVLRLTVTGCGGSASDNYTINVTDAHDIVVNAPPHAMASASPASASEGVTVTLDGSASYDPDGDALNYHWTQVGGPVVVLATPDEAIASFTAPNIATTTTLSFSLTVSDGALSSSNDTLVNVLWSNDPPIAVLSCPLEVNEGEELTLDGSDSVDNDNGIASYTWEQLVGLPVITGIETWNAGTATFHAPQLGFVQSGLVPFQLTVTDGSGAQSSAECSVFIHDITPPLISGATDIEAEATSAAGAAVSFALTAADAVDGDLSPLLQCVPPSGSTFAIAITQVTCQSKDSAQNLATASFNVIVADHIAPLIGFHNVVEVEATGPDGAWVDYTAPATSDAVDGDG
ncbi:MAG TPA: HYR domain-containing protein, partial [Lysobacter sp.]|nr:HYR domain-containing protein [Lysobacter sp.]